MKSTLTVGTVLSLLLGACASTSNDETSDMQEVVEEVAIEEETVSEEVALSVVATEVEPEAGPAPSNKEVTCYDDLACFLDAVDQNWTASYSDVIWTEHVPGVRYSTKVSWTYLPSANAYDLTVILANETPPSFEEGWFENYVRSESAPAELKAKIAELDAAVFPTEAELAEFDEETRAAIELQINSGKTAAELAWMSATYMMESQLYSTIMGVQSARHGCTSTNKNALLTTLRSLGTDLVLPSDGMPFLSCETSYEF